MFPFRKLYMDGHESQPRPGDRLVYDETNGTLFVHREAGDVFFQPEHDSKLSTRLFIPRCERRLDGGRCRTWHDSVVQTPAAARATLRRQRGQLMVEAREPAPESGAGAGAGAGAGKRVQRFPEPL